MSNSTETANTQLEGEAEEIESAVRTVHRLLRRPFDPDIARSELTVPQMNALEELTREDGLSLKELSGRMELSHSTVSGIVDRLERRELVGRKPDQKDRRYSHVFLSEGVKEYVRCMSPSRRLGPIPTALELASADEREQMLAGLGTLRRLLEAVVSDGGREHGAEAATTAREMEDLGESVR